jgi:hypothetical protein
MHPLKAHVENGRIVVDEPTNLPEGTELSVVIADGGDELDAEEGKRLHASIERGIADMRAGREKDLDQFLDELNSRAVRYGLRSKHKRTHVESAGGGERTAPRLRIASATNCGKSENGWPSRRTKGNPYRNLGGEFVRRMLLEKSCQHVYYVVREAEQLVSVVAIHGAVRGSGPDLAEH